MAKRVLFKIKIVSTKYVIVLIKKKGFMGDKKEKKIGQFTSGNERLTRNRNELQPFLFFTYKLWRCQIEQ